MMAASRRVSIALLMAVVFFLAVNLAIVRAVLELETAAILFFLATLPTANVLLLAAPRLRRGHPGRAFWLGFEVVGWPLTLAVGLLAWNFPGAFWWPLRFLEVLRPLASDLVAITIEIGSFVLLWTPPQLLVAWLAGLLSRRYRVRLVVGRRGDPDPGAVEMQM